jgi:hypothetical protein
MGGERKMKRMVCRAVIDDPNGAVRCEEKAIEGYIYCGDHIRVPEAVKAYWKKKVVAAGEKGRDEVNRLSGLLAEANEAKDDMMHRLVEERKAVVARLKRRSKELYDSSSDYPASHWVGKEAEAIERGEHLEKPKREKVIMFGGEA